MTTKSEFEQLNKTLIKKMHTADGPYDCWNNYSHYFNPWFKAEAITFSDSTCVIALKDLFDVFMLALRTKNEAIAMEIWENNHLLHTLYLGQLPQQNQAVDMYSLCYDKNTAWLLYPPIINDTICVVAQQISEQVLNGSLSVSDLINIPIFE